MAERAEFLLEIGCEEIPASWLGDLTAEFRSRFEDAARKAFLDPVEVAGFSTPRRLVLQAQLATRQADREENVFGPALKAARDASGGWTQAALGFARKNGVGADERCARSVERLRRRRDDGVVPHVVTVRADEHVEHRG